MLYRHWYGPKDLQNNGFLKIIFIACVWVFKKNNFDYFFRLGKGEVKRVPQVWIFFFFGLQEIGLSILCIVRLNILRQFLMKKTVCFLKKKGLSGGGGGGGGGKATEPGWVGGGYGFETVG